MNYTVIIMSSWSLSRINGYFSLSLAEHESLSRNGNGFNYLILNEREEYDSLTEEEQFQYLFTGKSDSGNDGNDIDDEDLVPLEKEWKFLYILALNSLFSVLKGFNDNF